MQTHFDLRGPEKLPLVSQALFLVHRADGFFLQSHLPSVYIFSVSLLWDFVVMCRLSRVARSGGSSLVAMRGLLTAVTSRGGAQALGFSGFCSYGAWASMPQDMWGLLEQGSNPGPLRWQADS